jgi:hypothetical protein
MSTPGKSAAAGATLECRAGARRGAGFFRGAGAAGDASADRAGRDDVAVGRFFAGDRFLAGFAGFSSDIQP